MGQQPLREKGQSIPNRLFWIPPGHGTGLLQELDEMAVRLKMHALMVCIDSIPAHQLRFFPKMVVGIVGQGAEQHSHLLPSGTSGMGQHSPVENVYQMPVLLVDRIQTGRLNGTPGELLGDGLRINLLGACVGFQQGDNPCN